MANTGRSADPADLVPSEFYLAQNHPNPFRERTTIKFCVAYRTRVTLEVFDSEGSVVRTLLDEQRDAGTYEVECLAGPESPPACQAGKGEAGIPAGHAGVLPEGTYIYRLRAGDFSETRKMVHRGREPSPCSSPGTSGS